MTKIYFDKLYRYPRIKEHCSIAIPVKEGRLFSTDKVAVFQDNEPQPVQVKVTSKHKDGSVRYMFVRFMADIPANKGTVLDCEYESDRLSQYTGMTCREINEGYEIDTKALKFTVKNNSSHIIDMLDDGNRIYKAEDFIGPVLKNENGSIYDVSIGSWQVVEKGPLCTIVAAKGTNKNNEGEADIGFEVRITAYAEKPWIELSYRIINTSDEQFRVASLVFGIAGKDIIKQDGCVFPFDVRIDKDAQETETDSTGCGDKAIDNSTSEGPIFHTRGIKDLDMIEKKTPVCNVRTMVGSSNYKTDFYIGKNGERVTSFVDDAKIISVANEHFAEVLYGTFMADRTEAESGVCMTVFQAQQNYPKAVMADDKGVAVMLVPEDIGSVVMQSGMAREQKVLLHFHSAEETLLEIDNRSLIYQMPDRPYISPSVFKESEVMLDIFPEQIDDDVEIALIGKADGHARCFGMLNWGDTVDENYTRQGRGNGRAVWSNNEYDYPHSCAMMYARTGVRRFLDYLLVSASHWMDVDICHYSEDPLRIGGQWEHTDGHCSNGTMVCSHEWVEGLLDYYHFSGDERGLEAAVGIGDNVLRLLETPMYAVPGEANARETGWALRTLTALYVETRDEKWVQKCDWIIGSFKAWEEEYGNWLAPYTDNTTIRVGFMISVAVGSVMRYYREFPSDDIKNMIISAVDDICENCMLPNGLFYYKELPSLARLGNNTLLLEALTIAYELTKDASYLNYGIRTFRKAIYEAPGKFNAGKRIEGDAVICIGTGTKGFAQSFIPLITYYKALSENGIDFNAR